MTATSTLGTCLCGAVRIRAALPSKWVAHCHCTWCRRAHGAPFVTWAGFEDAQVAITDPEARLRWYASSPGARRASCSVCGSPMLFAADRWPGEMHIARALLDDQLDRLPSAHVFYESHVAWLDVADDLPKKTSDE